MPRYFLGIDIGGTKSQALISDENGRALGLSRGGAGNHEDVGYQGLADTLAVVAGQALDEAGIGKEQLAGAGLGIAGLDWPSQRRPTLAAVRSLALGDTPVEIVNDTIIGLLAGAANGWGVAVVSGTRCNCWGWDRERRTGRTTGMGLRMGEAAGGFELVDKAIEAIALAWTRRGPPTRLTERFVQLAGAEDAADLLEGVSLDRYRLTASAAPTVFQVAAEGDPVAAELVLWAGRSLGSLANGVIRQLGFEALAFEVVLVGSFFNGSPLIIETMGRTIHTTAPGARLEQLMVPPVIGGVLLGMEQAGMSSLKLRKQLIQSTLELLT
jgi:N-acetylglucosamine kinase-like BadF-type ATPase